MDVLVYIQKEGDEMYAGIKTISNLYAEQYGITKREAEKRVKEMESLMREVLLNTEFEGIQFVDFLTLKKMKRKSKIGRNPKNAEQTFIIEPMIGIKCNLGKTFKEELNK